MRYTCSLALIAIDSLVLACVSHSQVNSNACIVIHVYQYMYSIACTCIVIHMYIRYCDMRWLAHSQCTRTCTCNSIRDLLFVHVFSTCTAYDLYVPPVCSPVIPVQLRFWTVPGSTQRPTPGPPRWQLMPLSMRM